MKTMWHFVRIANAVVEYILGMQCTALQTQSNPVAQLIRFAELSL